MRTARTARDCQTCGRPEVDHANSIHPYAPPGTTPARNVFAKGRGEPSSVKMPFDPVLRQALLDKGILTPQDIKDAEKKIDAIVQGGAGDGDGPQPR